MLYGAVAVAMVCGIVKVPIMKPTHRQHNKFHDYKSACIYHITMVVVERTMLLGTIVGEKPELARCELTPLGNMVSDCIKNIYLVAQKHKRQVRILAKQVMPDHVHFVLYVEAPMDVAVGELVRGFKTGCNKALRRAIERVEDEAGCSSSNLTVVAGKDGNTTGAFASSPSRLCDLVPSLPLEKAGTMCHAPISSLPSSIAGGHSLFEADYDETILRCRGQLRRMIDYVHDNPRRSWLKRHHRGLLRPHRGIEIAGRSYDAIGNLMLLGLTRHQVLVHSRITENEQHAYMNECIVEARRNKVLVSPFISEKEKQVRDYALKEGHSIIQLVDNGFSDYATVDGSLIDFSANGQVLILSPWPYVERKARITRLECQMLNEMAGEVANEGKK